MQEIVSHGTVLGTLHKSISKKVGLPSIPVLTTASHDTAAAVAAVPAEGKDWAYISSGTWSLMGVETSTPIITKKALKNNFTNEGGVEKTFRFLKNIVGLWLLQQCRRTWRKEYNYSYEELTKLSEEAEPFKYLIDPDNTLFYNPPSMPNAIRDFCRKTGQSEPHSHSEIVRCILESLALKYRLVLEQLNEIYSCPINKIHIIGGGSKNEVLCQYTADATGVPIISGPVEATSIGNILVQALALKHVSSLSEIRNIIRNSFELKKYIPYTTEVWDSIYERYKKIIH
jgi:rhamnulokinase